MSRTQRGDERCYPANTLRVTCLPVPRMAWAKKEAHMATITTRDGTEIYAQG
jgi:hypothetical protein